MVRFVKLREDIYLFAFIFLETIMTPLGVLISRLVQIAVGKSNENDT